MVGAGSVERTDWTRICIRLIIPRICVSDADDESPCGVAGA